MKDDGTPLSNPSIYHKLVGSLVYSTITRPDISHAVNIVSQFMTRLTNLHLAVVKRIIRYLLGTCKRGIIFPSKSNLILSAYYDANWAGCPNSRRSTTGWRVYLGNVLISWKCKKKQDKSF
eukprot:TRINITY_DN28028_c0_g2_i1.p1 TRINITY_DN28028_c0_g2~~TRINITY_DN28028_c0_g2_i1.p1  ORF type:complete len:121 (+),score=1.79 TRINITY_DN28028_c0_g2_i1:450-812(+)